MSGPKQLMRGGGDTVQGLLDLLAVLPGGLTMVEVGVYAGDSTRLFLQSGKVAWLYAVDPFGGDYEQDGAVWQSPYPWPEVRNAFGDLLAEWQPKLTLYEEPSLTAVNRFPNGTLDLVYLDGNHGYAAVAADIAVWLPKLRVGGRLAGHDYKPYEYPGVVRAVTDLLAVGRGRAVRTFADTSWLVEL